MKQLLSFKHWQLFLLIFICGAWRSPSPLREIINSIAVVTFTLWIYAVGVYGQETIAVLGLKQMNVKLFKINVVIVGSFFLISLVLSALFGEVTSTHDTLEFKDAVYYIATVYFAFALVQTIIFLCKTLSKIEYRREVTFGDYFLNILQMMFFFIGIWILQPKVNRFIKTNEVNDQCSLYTISSFVKAGLTG